MSYGGGGYGGGRGGSGNGYADYGRDSYSRNNYSNRYSKHLESSFPFSAALLDEVFGSRS